MKTRMIRINDEIARVTADVIRSELSDPRIGAVVSVIGAETTQDLKYCKIRVSIFGGEEEQKETMAGLGRAAGFIRKRVASVINLRQTPEISFVYDDSIEHGMRMRKLIDEVNK
ncbi:MAG: 30S ribosome-binding factor RbfA [Defluviitaleaceae bacterium]|nr:30S ribosome-binding factor RbfA [Defluviitaleaceae bacterium]MCL2261856.1 30S ribosome-binding factor RbfA [Defluviitaleaceae bacterium]